MIFVTRKQIFVSYIRYFSTLNSNVLLELFFHPVFCYNTRMLKYGWGKLLFYTECGHENFIITKAVVMSAQSQTARTCRFRHHVTRWDMQLSVGCAWGTLQRLWCAGLPGDQLQLLCVIYWSVLCKRIVFDIFSSCQGSVYTSLTSSIYVCGESTFKSQRRNSTLSLINILSFILCRKRVTNIKIGSIIFVA
jgi:hypothetical protein